MNTKIIKLDLNKSRLYEKIKAKQGDTESRFLLFQLFDGALPFSLKNRSVRAYMIKPDSKEVFNDLIINDRIKGYCTLELTNQVLAAPGTVKIELMITEGTKKLTSSVFELEVDKSINSEKSIVSTNEFTALLNGLASLSEYDNYKNELKDARDGEVNVGTNIRKIKSQLDNIALNVLSLGAKGDGVTDDTSVIQNILNNNIGKPVFFPNTTILIGNIIIPSGSRLHFDNTNFIRKNGEVEGNLFGINGDVKTYGDFVINGQKDNTVNPNISAIRVLGDNCEFNSVIEIKNMHGHGMIVTGYKNVNIDTVIAHDNGGNPNNLEIGIGDGLIVMDSQNIHVKKVTSYNNGRNGVTVSSYSNPTNKIVIDKIYSSDNGYVDIDLEISTNVSVDYIRPYSANYPSISVNHANQCNLINAEISQIYGETITDLVLNDITIFPNKNFVVHLVGENIKARNITYKDTLESYLGTAIEINDSSKDGYVENLIVENCLNGYSITSNNIRNILVKKYSNLVGSVNGRFIRSALFQDKMRVEGGIRYDYLNTKPTDIGNAGDITYIPNVTAEGTTNYYYCTGTEWLSSSIIDMNKSYGTSGLVLSDCTLNTGGYVRVGRLIIVNIRLTSTRTQSFGRIITGFPTPSSWIALTGFNNTKKSSSNGIIDTSGNLWVGTEINDDIILSATYKI